MELDEDKDYSLSLSLKSSARLLIHSVGEYMASCHVEGLTRPRSLAIVIQSFVLFVLDF